MATGASKITRSERALLRELAKEAWNTELYDHLLELHDDFGRWAADAISAFDLVEKIYEFHDRAARELYKRYAIMDPAISVARAIALGFVGEEALGEPLRRKLARDIQVFRESMDE
jgi:hypothetical protein